MLEMLHMASLLFTDMWGLKLTALSLPSWFHSFWKAVSSSVLKSESASMLILHPWMHWHKQFTFVNCVTCHQAATVKCKSWFSVWCPFLDPARTQSFVVGVSCSAAWNMLWCPYQEVDVCMRHSSISINSFKLYVSFWSCFPECETTHDVCSCCMTTLYTLGHSKISNFVSVLSVS
jgi:hypothetical protein